MARHRISMMDMGRVFDRLPDEFSPSDVPLKTQGEKVSFTARLLDYGIIKAIQDRSNKIPKKYKKTYYVPARIISRYFYKS